MLFCKELQVFVGLPRLPTLHLIHAGHALPSHAPCVCVLWLHLQVPRKAWPGLMRMPDLAGSAGSAEAVEAFVTLVRRWGG